MPFVAECPFCSKGKLLCPDHAVGWSATCPNGECASSFTITRSANAPSAHSSSQRLAAKNVVASNGSTATLSSGTEGTQPESPKPIVVPSSPGYASRSTPYRPQFTTAWNGATVFSLFVGSIAVTCASFLSEWPFVAIVAGVAVLALIVGLVGVSLASHRNLGQKRAWLGPFAPGAALALVALPFVTGERWGGSPVAKVSDLTQRTSVPIKPQSGSSQVLQATDWIDASKDLVEAGDVWLRITSVAVEPVAIKQGGRTTTSPDPWLVVRVQLANTGASRRFDYQSWADNHKEPSRHSPVLRDSNGRTYKQRTFAGVVVGQVASGFIFPGKSLDDVLVFEPPPGRFEHLRLELPLSAIGDEGHIRLQLPRAMIKFR